MSRTFEECYPEIEVIVEKHRSQWTFRGTAVRDFDDVKIEIITHIWKKWNLYDQSRPLGGWVATIVERQFYNLLRNIYLSTSSPCSRCACNLGNEICSMYGRQGTDCPLFKKWYDGKRHSHDARLPLSLEGENLSEIVNSRPDQSVNLEEAVDGFHAKMQESLSKSEWEIYRRIYIDFQEEEDVIKDLGFKTENGRKMGSKRIREVKTIAIKKGRKLLEEFSIEDFKLYGK